MKNKSLTCCEIICLVLAIVLVLVILGYTLTYLEEIDKKVVNCLNPIGEEFCKNNSWAYLGTNSARTFFRCAMNERVSFATGMTFQFTDDEIDNCNVRIWNET
jgi:hypothetical protein